MDKEKLRTKLKQELLKEINVEIFNFVKDLAKKSNGSAFEDYRVSLGIGLMAEFLEEVKFSVDRVFDKF